MTFRPHHFLCALCFQGKGYSPAFIENFSQLMNVLHGDLGDQTAIQIVPHTDSICAPCPHRIVNTCETEEKITTLDKAHLEALSLKSETKITWGEAKKRILEKITLEKFHQICSTCSWKKYGICESALNRFLNENS
jgi:uncharacterized protein